MVDLMAADIAAEADAMKVYANMIINRFQTVTPTREEAQDLLSAIYGLEALIRRHAEHAEEFANHTH